MTSLPREAHAQSTYFWRAEATDGNWQQAGNTQWWSNGGGATGFSFGLLWWDNTADLIQTNTTANASTFGFHFNSGASQALTFVGSSVRFFDNGNRIRNASGATHRIDMNLGLDGDAADAFSIYIDGAGGLTFNGTINTQPSGVGSTINVLGTTANATTVTFNGAISGAGGFYKENSNITALMTAANTYSGQTTIQGGTLRLSGSGSLANSAVRLHSGGTLSVANSATVNSVAEFGSGNAGVIAISNGATLTINGSTTGLFQNSISGAGNLTFAGGGLSLYGSQTYSGTTTVSGGTLDTGAAMSSGAYSLTGGTFRTTASGLISDTASMTLGGGTLSIGGGERFGDNGVTLSTGTTSTVAVDSTFTATNTGIVSGSGNLVKSNAGQLNLSGVNTYTGTTTVNSGSLEVQSDAALGSTAAGTTVNSGAELRMWNASAVTVGAEALTLNGAGIGNAGALRSVSGNNAWQGTISNAGGARINADANTLTLSNINSAGNNLYFGGSGNITVGGQIDSTLTSGDGALFKDGSGVLTLTNNNSGLTGLVRIRAGTISVTNANSLGTGTVELGGLGTTATLSVGTNTSRSQTLLISNNSTNSVISVAANSVFTNTGSLTQDDTRTTTTKFAKDGAGTLILNSASGNTYNGQLQIGQGTVVFGTTNAMGTNTSTVNRAIDLGLNVGDVSQGNNVALIVSNGVVTVGQSLYVAPNTSGGTRTVAISGAGSLTFSNAHYFDGVLIVDAGANATDSITFSQTITGGAGGGITKTNAGILVLSGTGNTLSNGVTLGSGTLRVGTDSALGVGGLTINGGTFAASSGTARVATNNITMGGNVTFGDATGTGNLTLSNINLAQAARTFTVGNATTIAGVISNGGVTAASLTKAGAGTLTLSGANTFSGGLTLSAGVLNLNNAAAAGTGTFTINGGTINNTFGSTVTLNNNAQNWNGDFTFTGSSNLNMGTGAVAMNATRTITVNGSTLTVGGIISGSTFGITKLGTGNLTLSGANSYTGATTITAGTLELGAANAISDSSAVTVNGGTWALSTFNDTVASVTMTSGSITRGGTGSLMTASGASSLTGGTVSYTAAGGISFGSTLQLGGVTFSYGSASTPTGAQDTVRLGGNVGYGSSATAQAVFTNTAAGVGAFDLGDSQRTFNITNSGTLGAGTPEVAIYWALRDGGLTKDGDGALLLARANTHTNTTLTAGDLLVADDASAGAGTMNLNGGVIASANSTNRTLANSLTIGGDVTFGQASGGTGALTFSSVATNALGGTRTLTTLVDTKIDGALGGGGITKAGSATLSLSNINSSFGALTINAGQVNFQTNAVITGLGGSAGSLALGGGTLTLNISTNSSFGLAISGAGNLVKSNAGTLTLTGANTFSGLMTVNGGGAISVGADTNLGTAPGAAVADDITLANGTLTVTTNFTMNANRGITLGTGGGTLDIAASQNLAYGGIIAGGANALTKANSGTLTLSGVSSYTGATTISGGTLALSGSGALSSSTAVNVSASGSAFDISGISAAGSTNGSLAGAAGSTVNLGSKNLTVGGANTSTTFAGVMSNTGSLTKVGTGTMTLTGANTYSGVTTISNGGIALGAASGTVIAGNVTIAGGTLDYTGAGANQVNTNSSITISSGLLNLVNRDQSFNSVTMSGGTVNVSTGDLTNATASSVTGGTNLITGTTGRIAFDGALTLGGAAFVYTNASASTDGVRLSSGGVAFSSTNTTGAVFSNAAAGVGRLNLNGTTVEFNIGDSASTNSEVNVAWAVENGSLRKVGAGAMTMTASNSYTATTLDGGTLRLGNNFALGTGTVTFSNGTIASDGSGARTFANALNIVGDATFGDTVGTGTITFSSTATNGLGGGTRTVTTVADTKIDGAIGNGNITKAGAATLVLSNASSSFGTLNISAGRVTFQTNATVTGLAASGGSLDLAGGTLTLNSSTDNSFGQAISGAGGLTKSSTGTLTLSGVNTYTGATTINGGAISVAAASGLGGNPGSATTNQLTLNGGALNVTTGFTANANAGITLGASGGTIDVAANQRLIQGGGLYGSGNVTKTGQGTMSLTNTSGGYSGTITVTNGVLQANTTLRGAAVNVGNASTVNGSVLMGSGQVGAVTINTNGQISPGNSVGTLSVSNSLTFNGGGSYLWEINGTNGPAGTTWDLITVDNASAGDGLGSLTIGGAFTITGSAIDGFSFDGAQNYAGFQIVKASSLTGSLGNLSLSGLGTGSWAFSFTNNVGLFASYTAAGSTITFTNSSSVDQGAANIAGGNALGAYATITNVGGATIVVISNTAPLTFTNEANSYTGATIIEEGTAVTMVNSLNAANGAFGNASTDIQVGSTNGGNANAATLLIGASGATVSRAITINSGGTGLRTVGATNSSGTATYSGNIAMATNVTLSASNSGGTTLFSGGLSGAGNVTAAGSGTVLLSGNNTYTGTTTVTNGTTLLIANSSALGSTSSGTTVQSGGTLSLSNNVTIAEALTISGTGVGASNGALRNTSGTNTISGQITIVDSGATIWLVNNQALTLSGGIVGTGQALTITPSSLNTNTMVTITGIGLNTGSGGTLVKTGGGGLTIDAASSFTGGTTLSAGTLRVGDDGALGTGDITIGGSSTLSSSSTTNRTLANNVVFSTGTLTLGNSTATGAMTLSGSVSLGGATRTITVASLSSPATISGVISGNSGVGLTKGGSGTLTLTGANTYDGATTISSGTLSIGSGGGTGAVAGAISNAGTLIVNRTGDLTLGGVISGAGTFYKLGSGTLLLSGNNTFTGALAISNGAVRVSNASGLGATNGTTTVLSGAALELTGGITTAQEYLTLNGGGINSDGALRNISGNNTYAGNITLGSASTIASDSGLLTISGGINGANFALTNTGAGNITISSAITNSSGTLVKEGLGTLTLTGANTYSGGTLVSAGTLVGDTTGLQGTITNSSLVIFDQSADGTYSSVVSGTGALIKTNTGILTLTGDNTYTGGTTIGAGALQIGNGGGTGSLAGTITNNGGLVFNRTGALSMTGAISGSGVLTNLGTGTVTLSGANTYSGGTLISAGALQGNTTSLQGTITNNGSVIFDQATDGTYSSALSGTGTLIKTNSGVLTLSGANTQGGTLIAGGTLSIGSGSTTGSLSGPITNNATLLFNRSDNITQGAVISGSGVLNKVGAGTLTLSQANTYEGATTISNGAISITDASALGTAAAGTTVVSGAALEMSGGITVASEALTLSGTGISTGGALRNISGNNAYNGAISLGAASRINSDAGTLSLGGGFTGTGLGLTIGGNANTTIGTTGINTGASGTLTKDGSGTLTITAAGDYTGATTVSAGVLNIQNATATGTTAGGISVTSGAALQIQGGITVGAEALTLNGSGISTDGALRNISGNNVYGGAITLGSASRINSDADSLTLNGGITGTGLALTIGGAGNTTIGTTGINTGAAGTLTKDGLGTLTITAAGDYTGATTVSAGALNIQNATATGTTAGGISVTSGAALELQGGVSVGAEALTLNGTGLSSSGALRNISGNNTYGGAITLGSASRINSDANTLTLTNTISGTQNLTVGGAGNTTISGAITTSTGTLTKDGLGTLLLSSGANTFTGNVNVSAGTLAVTNGGAIATASLLTIDSGATFSVLGGETVGRFTGAGTVNIANGQTLTTSFDSASNNFAGSMTGAGTLVKTGSGTFTLSGDNSGFSGGTTLNDGTLLVGATGAFGSGGTVTINFDTGTGTRALASADASSYTLNNNFNLFFNSFSLGSANTGSLTLGASTNTFNLGSDGVSTTRTITVTGNQIIGAAVTGGANNNLNKAGSGTLILAGDASALGGTITNSAGRLQIGNGSTTGTLGNKNVTVASSAELAFNRSDNLTYGGVASGAGTLLKLGAGTVTFTGANTYTGATTISNGSLALSGSGALSSSSALNIAASGANFSISGISGTGTEVASLTGASGSTVSLGGKALTFGANNANSTFAGEMSGTGGSFIKTGTGTVTLSGSNSMTGTAQLNDGTILIGNNFALGTNSFQIQFDVGGTKTLASDGSTARTLQITNLNVFNNLTLGVASTGTGALTVTGRVYLGDEVGQTRTITTATGTGHTFSGAVTGNRGMIKEGSGTLTLSGANTFGGGLQLNNGTILVGNNAALGTGTMQFDFADGGGTRTLAAVDASAYTLNNNFNLFFNALTLGQSGGTTGTLTLGASTNTFNLGSDGTSTTRTITVNGTQIIGAAVTGGGNNNLNKAGSGTLILAGDASGISGTITNSAGRLQIGNGSTTGTIGNDNVTVTSGAELAFNRSDNLSYGGVVSGAGSLLKFGAGTLTLSTANTFTGTLTIGAGGLSVSANNNLGGGTAMTISNAAKLLTTASFTSARSLTVGDGGAEINVATNTVFTSTGAVSGSTALTKTGGGTLSLSNASSSYNGTVAVTAGTMQVNGTASSMNVNITNSGSVLMGAGSIGAVTVNSGTFIAPGNSVGNLLVSELTLQGGGGYNWEINASTGTAGTDWDLITVGGGGGNVAINSSQESPFTIFLQGNPTGWNVASNYSWTIIDAGTLTGFATNAFAVNFGGFTGATPTGTFSFSNVSGNLVMAYAAAANVYNVTVATGAVDQGAGAGITGGTNQFTGDYTLNKLGAGTLVMTNPANNYTGLTTVKEGTIQIDVNAPNNAAGALGTANTAVIIGDSTNNVAAGFNIGVAGVTNGRGLSVVAGTGTADRVIGTTITSGVAEQAGTVAVNTNTTFNAATGGTLLVSGAVSGAGNITISNGGTNIFSGANTYSGTTTILTNATLTIANNSALGTTGSATTVNDGGTLALSNNISTAENITIAGSGGTNADGALRNLSGANTNSGTVTLSANATISADSGTRLSLSNVDITGAVNRSVTFDGAGTNIVTGSISTAGGSLTNRIIKSGSGELVISNNGATGTGQLRLGEGTVVLAAGSLTTSQNTGTRAIDIGLSGDAVGTSTAANATLLARSGVTVSNSIYVAPSGGDGSFTRTIGTDSTSGTVTYNNQMYLGGSVQLTSAGTANLVYSGNITNDGTLNVTKIGAGSLTLSANNTWRGGLIAGEGTTILSGGNAVWDTNAVTVSNNATLALGSSETIGSLAGAGTVTLGANSLVTGSNSSSTTYSGVIGGTGGIFKNGTGTFTLAGANTYSGDTIVNGGTLAFSNGSVNSSIIRLGPDNSAGNTTILLSDSDGGTTVSSTLVVQADAGSTRSLVSSNSSGTNTYGGSIYLDGTATISQQAAGVFALTGSEIDVKSRTLTLSSVTNGNVAVSSTIFDSDANTGNIAKTGNGTVTLTGANAYAGTTLISGGTLQVGDGGATGQLGAGNVTNNASLVVNRTGSITIGNTISGTGSLTKTGAGTLTLGASNSFGGNVNITGGAISISAANRLGATNNTLTLDGGTLLSTASFDLGASRTLNIGVGGGTLFTDSGTQLTFNGIITNASTSSTLTKLGLGTLSVGSGSGSFTGNSIVGQGVLLLTTNTALSQSFVTVSNGAVLTNNFSNQTIDIGDLEGAGTVNAGSNSVTVGSEGNNTAFSGAVNISGSNNFTTVGSGTLTLSGKVSDTQTGSSIVGAGALQLSGADNRLSTNAALAVSNGAVLDLNGVGQRVTGLSGAGTITNSPLTSGRLIVNVASNANTFSGALQGGIDFEKTGAGTMVLAGNNGFTGAVNVLGGTLSVGADNNLGNAANAVTLSNNTAAVNFSSSFSSSRNFTVATGTTGTLLAGSGVTTTLGGSLSKNGSVLVFGGGGSFIVNGVISGASANSDLVVSNSTVTLNSANTYSGPTYVHSGGTLNVGINNAMPTNTDLYLGTNATSGTVNLQGFNQTVASLQIQGSAGTNNVITLGGGNLTVNGSSSSAYAGLISGAGSVVKAGTGTLALTAANTYSGSTTISNGTLQVSLIADGGVASSIGTGSTVTMAGTTTSTNANAGTTAVMDYTGGNVTTDRAFVMENGGGTINMATSTTEMTLTGSASGSGKLIVGEGTLILNGGNNAFAPGSIQVDSGATLQLAANNQIGDSTGLILNGGTFRVGTATTGFSDTLGTLTLSASSTIDLGAWSGGSRQLSFTNSSAITWTGTLTITNWQGVALQSSDVAEILFGTGGLTSAQLAQVSWANQNIDGGTLVGVNGELVPIPEPRVYAAAVALLAAVGWRERKRLIGLLRRKR